MIFGIDCGDSFEGDCEDFISCSQPFFGRGTEIKFGRFRGTSCSEKIYSRHSNYRFHGQILNFAVAHRLGNTVLNRVLRFFVLFA